MTKWLCLLIGVLLRPALADGLPVVVSIPPQKYFLERVGAELVSVEVLVGPGQSPVGYEPTARQLETMSRARLFVRIGVPFEQRWMSKFARGFGPLDILDARDGIDLRAPDSLAIAPGAGGEHTQDHAHDHQAMDPHVWLSPPLVKEMARRLRDRLGLLDPANQEHYESNFTRFAADLDALDSEIREMLRPYQGMHFLVFHPAWGYFADTYGLRQIAVETGSRAPGPKTLGKLVDLARAHDIRTVFVERQFGARTARAVADAIGGRVVIVDPLAEDYLDNMRSVARSLTAVWSK